MSDIRLGDVCDVVKGNIGITKAVPGKYPMVTTAEKRKSHKDYQLDTKAVLIPLVSATGHGHASINRVHYQEGKFSFGSILAACVPKNPLQYSAKFLHIYFTLMKDLVLVPLMKGSANVSLTLTNLRTAKIPDITLEAQLLVVRLYERLKKEQDELNKQFIKQKLDIGLLRQSILQEAVQGKLTRAFRESHPELCEGSNSANALLEKIKAEKEALVKAKKIKKEKPLPPITQDEIPYEIPESWVWCRMGKVSDIQRGSSPRPKGDPLYFSESVTNNHWISIKDISKHSTNNVLLDTNEYLTDLGTKFSRYVSKNELIVAVSGSTTGKCCLTGIEGYFYDGIAMVRLIGKDINPQYQLIYYLQQYSQMNDAKFGAAFPNINTKFLSEMNFPLPPVAEQKAIVKKVNALMALCDSLEKEIEQNTLQVEQLMQSSLREVLEGKV